MAHLRLATIDDALFLYELRNDQDARINSHNTEPIDFHDHTRWLIWNLKDQWVQLFILVEDGEAIGQIRVEEENTGKLVSFAIAPDHRGRGYGRVMLQAMIAEVWNPMRFKAEIKDFNLASRKLVESVGFVLSHERNGICYYVLESAAPDVEYNRLAVLRHL